ncbi:MAG: hypothetical protein ACT4P0_11515 [Panacagrimonas sp.]
MTRTAAATTLSALAVLASFTALPARAAEEGVTPSHLDLYYIANADLEINDFEFDDGDGYGAKALFMLGKNFFLTGEYQNSEYDPVNRETGGPLGGSTRTEVEIESYRGGLGVYIADSPFFVRGEYIGLESELSTSGDEDDEETLGDDFDENGWGAHAGIDGAFGGLGLHGQVGYVDVGDAGDGIEWLGGASFAFNPGLGIFADYRRTELENDDETTLQDFRLGLRVSF